MPNFWDAASAGFQRGVPLGADLYQRALDNARQAREDARQQALDKEKRAVQQRATRLAEQVAKQQMLARSLEIARERATMKAEEDARAAAKQGRGEPVSAEARKLYAEAYGVTIPEGATMGSVIDTYGEPAAAAKQVGEIRERRTPSVSHSYSHRDPDSADPLALGQVEAAKEYDRLIAEAENSLTGLASKDTPIRQQIGRYQTARAALVAKMGAAEVGAYRTPVAPVDESEEFLPGISVMARQGSPYLPGGALTPARPLVEQPVLQEPPPVAPDTTFDFLDDLEF